MKQTRLAKQEVKYSYGPYNKSNDQEQWIRLTEGCPNQCEYCYEPKKIKLFEFPEIVRNKVKIMDMNLLCKETAIDIIKYLGTQRVNNKVVYYELTCGVDYRFLTQEIAHELKLNRFKKIRIAWDYEYKLQVKIKNAIKMLTKAGYKSEDIMIFMICNWKISFQECMKKLELCKYWNVKVADCYYNNQTSPNIIPGDWKSEEIKTFRRKVRFHNQLVNFKIDVRGMK